MPIKSFKSSSGGYYYQGTLSLKKGHSKSKRPVLLCLPVSCQDVKLIHDAILKDVLQEHQTLDNSPDYHLYGHIATSAISGFPLLILGPGAKTFVHFSQVVSVRDEIELRSVCHFSIVTDGAEYRFKAASSVDYQGWMQALQNAFAEGNRKPNNPPTFRPPASPASDDRSSIMTSPRLTSSYPLDLNKSMSLPPLQDQNSSKFNVTFSSSEADSSEHQHQQPSVSHAQSKYLNLDPKGDSSPSTSNNSPSTLDQQPSMVNYGKDKTHVEPPLFSPIPMQNRNSNGEFGPPFLSSKTYDYPISSLGQESVYSSTSSYQQKPPPPTSFTNPNSVSYYQPRTSLSRKPASPSKTKTVPAQQSKWKTKIASISRFFTPSHDHDVAESVEWDSEEDDDEFPSRGRNGNPSRYSHQDFQNLQERWRR